MKRNNIQRGSKTRWYLLFQITLVITWGPDAVWESPWLPCEHSYATTVPRQKVLEPSGCSDVAGHLFYSRFWKMHCFVGRKRLPPTWSHPENFVLHKGLDFGQTLSLDFLASEPADPAHRSFQVVVFKKEEGCCLGISLGFRGQCRALWGQPDLGEPSFCPAAPGRHQNPRAVHMNETTSGSRRKGDSP